MSDRGWLLFALVTIPWALLGVVALLRGYNISFWRPGAYRRKDDEE